MFAVGPAMKNICEICELKFPLGRPGDVGMQWLGQLTRMFLVNSRGDKSF